MKRISLTQGQFALVDDEDFERLSQFKWCAAIARTGFVATTKIPIGKHHRKNISMSRLIMDDPPDKCVDHKNHNCLDNRKCNLRICTYAQNNCNHGPGGRTCKYKGVSFRASRGTWRVNVRYGNKNTPIGDFHCSQEAALAYDKKAKELHGEFAWLNVDHFPELQGGRI